MVGEGRGTAMIAATFILLLRILGNDPGLDSSFKCISLCTFCKRYVA